MVFDDFAAQYLDIRQEIGEKYTAAVNLQPTSFLPPRLLGHRGVDADNADTAIKHRGKFKTLTEHKRKLLKRRQAIEPIIGHLKADYRMDRSYLKGER